MRDALDRMERLGYEDLETLRDVADWVKGIESSAGLCVHARGWFLATNYAFRELTGLRDEASASRWFFAHQQRPDVQKVLQKTLARSELSYTVSSIFWGDDSLRLAVRARNFRAFRIAAISAVTETERAEIVRRSNLPKVE